MNSDHSVTHKSSKCVGAYLPSNNLWGSFQSPLGVPPLKLLDLFYQNLFNNIDNVIIRALICLHDIFLSFFFSISPLFFFFIVNCVNLFLAYKKVLDDICDSQ